MSHAKLPAGLGALPARLSRWRMFSVPFVLILMLALGGAALVGAASALFEIDGNTANDATPGVDWADVIPGPYEIKTGFPVSGTLIADPHSKKVTDPNIFSPSGKFGEPEKWTVRSGNVGPAQNELTNVTVMPLQNSQSPDGDEWMFMSLERTKTSGTFDLHFEFNQVPWNGLSGTLVRTPGDLSVIYELKGNPTDPQRDLTVLILKYDPANTSCQSYAGGIYGGGWCTFFSDNASALGAFGAATMNATAFDPEWTTFDESGNERTEIPPFQFAEAGINLTDAGLEPASCPGFGSVYASTRSSTSFTADLKDLGGPVALPIACDARISITPLQDTNEVNDTHVLTAKMEVDDGSGVFAPAADGTVITFQKLSGPGVLNPLSCTTTGGTGSCSTTLVSSEAGTSVVQASSTVTLGGQTFTRTTGISGNGNGNNSPNANKLWVDANIQISPLYDTNEINDNHVLTGHVNVTDANGNYVNAPAGTVINFAIASGPGSLNQPSCTTTDNSGSCSVTLTSSQTGVTVVNASTTVNVGGLSLTRATDGVGQNSGSANKLWVNARIDVTPLNATNSIQSPHTITATVQQDTGSGFGPAPDGTLVSFSLLNNSANASFDGPNTCTTTSGSCSVQINSLEAGSVDIRATASFDISVNGFPTINVTRTTGSAGNGPDANKVYVAGTLIWEKRDAATNELLGGATFEVCRTHEYDPDTQTFTDTADVCISVLDNNAPDADPIAGEFKLEDLVLGKYTLRESAAPAGYEGDLVTLRHADVISDAVVDAGTFLNEPLFKIIVLVCRESNNSLYGSAILVDGELKTSLPSGDNALCNTGGANYGSKLRGNHPANVQIPDVALP